MVKKMIGIDWFENIEAWRLAPGLAQKNMNKPINGRTVMLPINMIFQ
jgi:hypothetical protein